MSALAAMISDRSYSVENPPRQGRKADTARVRGLSALLSSAPTGVDRLLPFFTSFPLIPRFCLDLFTPELCSGMPSVLHRLAGRRMGADAKRRYYTKRRGNSPCRLRPNRQVGCRAIPVAHPVADRASIWLTALARLGFSTEHSRSPFRQDQVEPTLSCFSHGGKDFFGGRQRFALLSHHFSIHRDRERAPIPVDHLHLNARLFP
jgi:hypothetical protein